ncbi:Golgi reassembly-stacking protein 2 [Condylostylus longicornis]|uniref:Golgi reassembly-stacking protein 2 n=1 Tax=Condylostylus longicornis TaxID=2530218 RepID=UPI00244E3751|nr:Golgi reassembly-stacking protein 2 [Condylostylus longicornis]
MGAGPSIEVPGGGTEGYHVLRVQENSPGQKANLEAFFDFIVAIGNTRLDQDNDTLKELLKTNVDKQIKMTVYSSKTQSVREVLITPSSNWGGQGLLGVSIRFCSFEGANENVWHILEVHPSSPAEQAGLRAFSDYIIGADAIRHESDDLFTLIETHEGQSLKMYVYNIDDDTCREVTLKPNSKWGGEGSLGCGIGFGYLHRIPIQHIAAGGKPLFKSSIDTKTPINNSGFLQQKQETSKNIEVAEIATVNPSFPYVPPLTNTFTTNAPPLVTPITTVSTAPLNLMENSNIEPSSNEDISRVTQNIENLSIDKNSNQQTITTPSTQIGIPPLQDGQGNIPTTQTSLMNTSQHFISNEYQQQTNGSNTLSSIQPSLFDSANTGTSIMISSPSQISNIPPPSNIPGFNNQMPNISQPSVQSNPAYINQNAYLSYPTFNSDAPNFFNQQQHQQYYSPQADLSYAAPPFVQTYSSFPQVQQTSVSTPISLPGMPPLTVTTTIPETLFKNETPTK